MSDPTVPHTFTLEDRDFAISYHWEDHPESPLPEPVKVCVATIKHNGNSLSEWGWTQYQSYQRLRNHIDARIAWLMFGPDGLRQLMSEQESK